MAATSSSSGSNHNALQAIDRTTTTPVLLRCFWRLNQHHSVAEFRQADKEIFPAQEVQIYTWPDATLREITELLKDAIPAIRDQHAHVSYNLIFIDRASFWQTKPIGKIHSRSSSADDAKTLAAVRFEAGDMLDLAIYSGSSENGGREFGRGDRGGRRIVRL